MRAKYPQADGRGIVPRKWSVSKEYGPLVLIAERIQKKLIQHGWPVSYTVHPTNRLFPVVCDWINELGETPEFLAALQRATEITAREFRVTVQLRGSCLTLTGEWVVRFRYAGGKVAAVTIHPAPDCPF